MRRVGATIEQHRAREGTGLLVDRGEQRLEVEPTVDSRVGRRTLLDDRPEQLPREGRRQEVGTELVDGAKLEVGHAQEQPEQLGLARTDRSLDLGRRELVGGRADRLEGQPDPAMVGSGPLEPPA